MLLIRDYIGEDPLRFKILFDLLMQDEEDKVMQRAAWAVSHCTDKYPQLMAPHLGSLVKNLKQKGLHDAIKRNSIRILTSQRVPKKLQGRVATLCFDYLLDPQEKAATRVHAMQVLYELCREEPDLAGELRLVLEEQMPLATTGFRSRAKRILKGLSKLEK
ncbi:MAG: hypothetical protein AAF990_20880 [Bacteroidota bacterium]